MSHWPYSLIFKNDYILETIFEPIKRQYWLVSEFIPTNNEKFECCDLLLETKPEIIFNSAIIQNFLKVPISVSNFGHQTQFRKLRF